MAEGDRQPHEVGLAELVSQLAGDAREVASAEVGLVKARAVSVIARYKAAATYFSIAGVLALCGFIALLVGLIETLATIVGPGWATIIICGVVFAVAIVLALIGRNRLASKVPKA